eukprot:gene25842-biopygen13561
MDDHGSWASAPTSGLTFCRAFEGSVQCFKLQKRMQRRCLENDFIFFWNWGDRASRRRGGYDVVRTLRPPPKGTLARARRGHGAGVARAIGIFPFRSLESLGSLELLDRKTLDSLESFTNRRWDSGGVQCSRMEIACDRSKSAQKSVKSLGGGAVQVGWFVRWITEPRSNAARVRRIRTRTAARAKRGQPESARAVADLSGPSQRSPPPPAPRSGPPFALSTGGARWSPRCTGPVASL